MLNEQPEQVRQGKPFDPSITTLAIPNSMATINGVSASSFLNQVLPYANKASTMTVAEQQVAANTPDSPKEPAE